jgi:hypothetical protein
MDNPVRTFFFSNLFAKAHPETGAKTYARKNSPGNRL